MSRRGASVSRQPFAAAGAWLAYFDERSGRDYFSNSETMSVTWACPPELTANVNQVRAVYPVGTVPPPIGTVKPAAPQPEAKSESQTTSPEVTAPIATASSSFPTASPSNASQPSAVELPVIPQPQSQSAGQTLPILQPSLSRGPPPLPSSPSNKSPPPLPFGSNNRAPSDMRIPTPTSRPTSTTPVAPTPTNSRGVALPGLVALPGITGQLPPKLQSTLSQHTPRNGSTTPTPLAGGRGSTPKPGSTGVLAGAPVVVTDEAPEDDDAPGPLPPASPTARTSSNRPSLLDRGISLKLNTGNNSEDDDDTSPRHHRIDPALAAAATRPGASRRASQAHNPTEDGEVLDLSKHLLQSPIAHRSSVTLGPGSSQRPSITLGAGGGHRKSIVQQHADHAAAAAAAASRMPLPEDPNAPVYLGSFGPNGAYAAYFSPPADRCYFYDLRSEETMWECPPEVAIEAAAAETAHKQRIAALAAAAAAAPASAPATATAPSATPTPAAAPANTAAAAPAPKVVGYAPRASKPLFRSSTDGTATPAAGDATPAATATAAPVVVAAAAATTAAAGPAAAPVAASAAPAGTPVTASDPLHAEVSATAPLPLVREGVVEKLTNGFRRGWKPRFLMLADNTLRYWDTQAEASANLDKPRGEGNVSGCSIVRVRPEFKVQHGIHINTVSGKETVPFTIKFSRHDDLEAWVAVLVRLGALDARAVLEGPTSAVVTKFHKTKRVCCLLYVDRVELFLAPDAAASIAADDGEALGHSAAAKADAVFPITRGSSARVMGSMVTVTVEADARRGVDATTFSIMFETGTDAQQWGSAITKSIAGPLSGVFGGDLAWAVKRSPYRVPAVVYACITFLKVRGLTEEGLLRVPGHAEGIAALRNAADAQVANLSSLLRDPHTVAGVLKMFFRELNDPVIPYARYAEFTSLGTKNGRDLDAAVGKLVGLVASLPVANRETLAQLLYFLKLVAKNSDANKMQSKNCAMVFAPSLLRVPESEGQVKNPQLMAELLLEQEGVVRLLIDHYDTIFPRGPPYI